MIVMKKLPKFFIYGEKEEASDYNDARARPTIPYLTGRLDPSHNELSDLKI